MIQFICDSCSRAKPANELWILGLAAEAVGVTAARREASILSAWTRENAVHPLAIHFCSDECKRNYMDRLFSEPNESVEIEETVTRATPKKKRAGNRAKTVSRTHRRKRAA
jgi:hypothetical protein